MEEILAVVVGVLVASGVYLLLRRSLFQVVLGLGLLSNAVNLLIFTAGGLRRGVPPIIPSGASTLPEGAADPLPQALILTAIVITFGVQAFLLVLVYRAYEAVGSDDPDAFLSTDDPDHEADAEPPEDSDAVQAVRSEQPPRDPTGEVPR